MKHLLFIPVVMSLAVPVQAQEESTLEKLFDFLELFSEETQPIVEELMNELAPKLENLQNLISDWSLYEAPEVLPNGDIIIRRKPDVPNPDKPFQKEPREI